MYKRQLELHGSMRVGRCARCGREREMAELMALPEEPPTCVCGGLFRPGVVWFGEALPQATFARAVDAARRADLFVAIGTSATVHPAAGLIDLAHRAGARIVEVNLEETPATALAESVFRGAASVELPKLTAALLAEGEAG